MNQVSKIHVVIPARMESSRLPNKALLDIAGKSMLQHVFERASRAKVDSIIVATDSEQVQSCAEAFGAEVVMTARHHASGTERIAEVISKKNFSDRDVIVNVQCDEPLLPHRFIEQVAEDLINFPDAAMSTLYEEIKFLDEIDNPNIVKVVFDQQQYALYFSRAIIPWHRDGFTADKKTLPKNFVYKRHIGLYAYRAAFIKRYIQLPASPLETVEMLEQLRVLYYGEKIHMVKACEPVGIGVDTQADLEKVRAIFRAV